MKKVLTIIVLMLLTIVGCQYSEFGKGGDNAAQYVKEQVPGLRENIESIETIAEDSLLGDLGLTFASLRLANFKKAFYEKKVTYEELDRVVDSCQAELMAVEQSWMYGTVSKKVKKFKNQWRKVYTVRVTMKSGITKESRVLMDQDGITPRMLEMDFMQELTNYHLLFTH